MAPLLQFAIALFTGMVAATFIPPVRKAIPRPVEVLLWVGLVVVCGAGLLSITNENARSLTTSVLWGADRVINTIVGLLLGGAGAWIMDHRFSIATWLAIIAGVDIFAVMLLRSIRTAHPRQPRVRLREWMEVPVPVAPVPAHGSRRAADPLVDVSRRLAAAGALVGAAILAKTIDLAIWIRNVILPREGRRLARAAHAGRLGSRARLESLRDAAAHLQFAARAWYAAAGEPAMGALAGHLASTADGAVRTARATRKSLRAAAWRPGQVVDVQALLSAQSIGWYGPLGATEQPRVDIDADQSPQTDRLAS